jgi:predicted RNA-binding Zn-ribbon protein involved in translation (DUF1610 family)
VFGKRKITELDPLFFCESCSAEVEREAKSCPECGKNFASVRCPTCNFIGEVDSFKGGCPACGYVSEDQPKKRPKAKRPKDEPLPLWVYVITVAIFSGILAALFITIF